MWVTICWFGQNQWKINIFQNGLKLRAKNTIIKIIEPKLWVCEN
jgi:hypothetical protein